MTRTRKGRAAREPPLPLTPPSVPWTAESSRRQTRDTSGIRARGPKRHRDAAWGGGAHQALLLPGAPHVSPLPATGPALASPHCLVLTTATGPTRAVPHAAPPAHAPLPAGTSLVGTAPFRADPDPSEGHLNRTSQDTCPATASHPHSPLSFPLSFSLSHSSPSGSSSWSLGFRLPAPHRSPRRAGVCVHPATAPPPEPAGHALSVHEDG